MTVRRKREATFQEFQEGKVDLVEVQKEEEERVLKKSQSTAAEIWKIRIAWSIFGGLLALFELYRFYFGWFEAIPIVLETSAVVIALGSTFLMFSKFVLSAEIFVSPLSYLDTSPGETTLNLNQNIARSKNYAEVKQGYIIACAFFALGLIINAIYVKLGYL